MVVSAGRSQGYILGKKRARETQEIEGSVHLHGTIYPPVLRKFS